MKAAISGRSEFRDVVVLKDYDAPGCRMNPWIPIIGLSVVVFGPIGVPAQTTAPATPRPAHERLTFLEGTWTKKDLPPGEHFRDTCAWLPEGRRHMICRQRRESPRGVTEQMAIFSYRGSDTTYLLTVLLANGQVWRYEGRPEADRWIFDIVPARPDSPRVRQVLIPAGDTIRFLEEVSENRGPWRLSDPREDFTYVRER